MIPNRRNGAVVQVSHGTWEFDVTFNFDPGTGRVAECFYAHNNKVKHGSDFDALLIDACVAVSKRAEAGEGFAEIAASFGEDRPPGAAAGPPSSVLGAIARAGAALDAELGEAP